jgi:hypothetical protein
METLAIAVLLGLIPAFTASKKWRSFLGWWLFGAALLTVTLPVSLMIGPNTEKQRKYPACASWMPREAVKWQHWGTDLNGNWGVARIRPSDHRPNGLRTPDSSGTERLGADGAFRPSSSGLAGMTPV